MGPARHWSLVAACLFIPAHLAAQPGIAIRVVEGDGAINNIQLRKARDPVVQVVNAVGEPVHGATVHFVLPSAGAGGTFLDGGLSLTVQTGPDGVAAGRGLRPNRIPGQFRIRVNASWNNQTAAASITQTNAGAEVKTGNRSRTILVLALIGGAAAGGTLAATRGGSKSGAAAAGGQTGSAAGTVIVPGNPTFGPPR